MAEMDLKVNLDLAVTKSADKRLSGYDQLLYTRIAQIANASKTNAANQGLDNELLKELYLLSANWEATTNYVKELVDEKILLDEEGKLTVDLSTYWNATETKAYVDQKIGDNIQADWNEATSSSPNFIKNKPTNVSEFTNDAGYLTKHQDLTSYATKDFVTEELAKIDTSGSGIDLSAYATYDDLAITLLPTETVIQDVFNLPNGLYYVGKSIPFTTGTFLCGDNALAGLFEVIPGEDANSKTILYLSKCEYGTLDKNGNITTPKLSVVTYTKDEIDTLLSNVHVDLTGYATEEFVNNAVASHEPDLTGYVSKEELEAKKYLTEHQNLDNYATHDYVMEQITNVATGGTVDLTGYASKEYVDQKIGENLSGLSIPTKLSELENDTNFITADYIAGLDLSGVSIATFEGGSIVDLVQAEDGFYYIPATMSYTNSEELSSSNEFSQIELFGLIHLISYKNKLKETFPNMSDEEYETYYSNLIAQWDNEATKWVLLSHYIIDYDNCSYNMVDYNGNLREQGSLSDSYTTTQVDEILQDYTLKVDFDALAKSFSDVNHITPLDNITSFQDLLALEEGFYNIRGLIEQEIQNVPRLAAAESDSVSNPTHTLMGLTQVIPMETYFNNYVQLDSKLEEYILQLELTVEAHNVTESGTVSQRYLDLFREYISLVVETHGTEGIPEEDKWMLNMPATVEELTEEQKSSLLVKAAEMGTNYERAAESLNQFKGSMVICYTMSTAYMVGTDGNITGSFSLDSNLADDVEYLQDQVNELFSKFNEYVTTTALEAKGYLTANDMPSFGFLKSEDLASYATQSYVQEAIAQASLGTGGEGPAVDLSVYATKEYVNSLGHITKITNAQTIDEFLARENGYYDIDNVKNVVLDIIYNGKEYHVYGPVYLSHVDTKAIFWDLKTNDMFTYSNDAGTGVYTLVSVSTTDTSIIEYINGQGYLTAIPEEFITESELVAKGYATEEFVTQAISNSGTGSGSVDLTGYATETYVNTKVAEAKLLIPTVPTAVSAFTNDSGYLTMADLSSYATINYVDTAIVNAKLGSDGSGTTGSDSIDLSKYATIDYVDSKVPKVLSALTNDTGFITSTAVDNKIAAALADFNPATEISIEFETVNIDFSNFTF